MKKIAVITTSKELKEFQERTDIRILDINVKACDQTWATQEYFVATIVYDDDLNSDPDYWEKLKHRYAGQAMEAMLTNPELLEVVTEKKCLTKKEYAEKVACVADIYATALVKKLKGE